jgi:mono/diheme cytochrome c family protein
MKKVILVVSCLVFSACTHEKPNFVYMPDMVYGPAIKAQKEGSMRPPVAGTIPRGYQPYAYSKDPEAAGKFLKSPIRMTKETMARGQKMFNTYCIVCHGPYGEGDGSVTSDGAFPRPPSLQSEKIMKWSDGRIYHVITVGQNLMPSYASQVGVEDRWAIIQYVRAIQRAKHPTPEDLKAASKEGA